MTELNQPISPEIMDAMNALLAACGLSGESGTELLYYWLADAVEALDGTIEASHEQGLCYDMNAAMADVLTQYKLEHETQEAGDAPS